MNNPYHRLLLEAVPRILSHLDRDSTSPTYGCFDRNFWLYHLTDFPSAVLQQNCWTLALLYTHDFKGNVYYQNSQINVWAKAVVSFWAKIQNKDGSFNEYWQGERGLPPTVFSVIAVAETIRLLHLEKEPIAKKYLEKLKTACSFMERTPEAFASNQEVAAACAIYSVYLLTEDSHLEQFFYQKLAGLKRLQSEEGFFYEQSGADAGYLTVSLNYLGWLFNELPETNPAKKEVKAMSEKALNFLSYIIHPDGSLGGEYGSRNTEYLLPGGLMLLSSEFSLAKVILHQHGKYLFAEPRNFSVDDRYLLHYFGHSFALAALNHVEDKKKVSLPSLPFQETFIKHFPEAGLFIAGRQNLYLLINLKKGGVFKLYSRNKLLANDLGYRIRDKSGKLYFSEFGHEKPAIKINEKRDKVEIEITKMFSPKEYLLMSPAKRFALYFFSAIFGWHFRSLVKEAVLKKEKKSPYLLIRRIELSATELRITDRVNGRKKDDMLLRVTGQSVKLIPSSKFFQITELENKIPAAFIPVSMREIITEINLNKSKIKTNYSF